MVEAGPQCPDLLLLVTLPGHGLSPGSCVKACGAWLCVWCLSLCCQERRCGEEPTWPTANLVDPASSRMLRSRAKPCMSQRTWPQQWICEWLLTSAVISVIECGWHHLPDAQLDILQNLVANTRSQQSASPSCPVNWSLSPKWQSQWWIAPSCWQDQHL